MLFRIFLRRTGAQRRRNTRCATHSSAFSSTYCVNPLLRDRPLSTGIERFAYSLAVVHFRKIGNKREIGSDRNGRPVIYLRGYMPAYYQPENDDGRGKSSR